MLPMKVWKPSLWQRMDWRNNMKTDNVSAKKDRLTSMQDVMVGQSFIACLQDVLAEVSVRIEIARGQVYLGRYRETDFQVTATLYDQLNAAQQKRERAVRRRENNRGQGHHGNAKRTI